MNELNIHAMVILWKGKENLMDSVNNAKEKSRSKKLYIRMSNTFCGSIVYIRTHWNVYESNFTHILSPLSKGLFKRAILESGTIMNPKDDLDFFVRNALTVLNRTSCANTNDILKCLQGLPVSEIIDNQSDGILRFRWTFGDDFLPYTPMEVFSQGLFDNSFDLLLGNQKNEFSIFMTALDSKQFNPLTPAPLDYQKALVYLSLISQRESLDFYRELYFGPYTNDSNYLRSQIEKAYSDSTLVCLTYIFGLKYALKANKSGGKVYGYYHTQKPASSIFKVCDVSPWMGTCHGAELPNYLSCFWLSFGCTRIFKK
uniref:Carboxylesterase type B domain-containing protein n=1 Tax=Tetranychus urticae TaxID=32264 RepID=T1KGR2_TETUR